MSAIVSGLIGGVVANLVMFALQRRAARAATPVELPLRPAKLRLSGGYAAIGVVGLAILLVAIVGTIVAATDACPSWIVPLEAGEAVLFASVFLAFGLMGVLSIVGWAIPCIEVDSDGARGIDAFFRRFDLRWADVLRVQPNLPLRYWRIDVPGRVVRVSFDLVDAPLLAAHVLHHVPEHVVAPARAYLEAAAQARQPDRRA